MKICPICDNKISGRWCKNCHRFVNPWELKNDIYINETHASSKDAGCEYHNPSVQYDNQEYMQPGYENRIYGNAASQTEGKRRGKPARQNQPVQQKQSAGEKRNSQGKTGNNAARTVRIVVIVYVIIFFLSVIVSLISSMADESGSFSDFIGEIVGDNKEEESVNTGAGEEGGASAEDLNVLVTKEEWEEPDHDFLSAITPVFTEKTEYGETYEYYAVSDVQSLNHACDAMHMDFTIDDFLDMMPAVFLDYDITMEEYSDSTMNYVIGYPSQDYSYVRFETEYRAVCDEFTLVVSSDTSTGEVHSYEFRTYDAQNEFYTAVYSWFEAYIPEAFDSESGMLKFFEDVKETGGYQEMECDNCLVSCFLFGEYVTVTVGPLW